MNKVRAFALTKNLLYRRHISSRNRCSSAPQQDYTVEEISIPINTSQQKIACKLWKSTKGSELEPPVICVHGWLDNAGSFDTLLPKLMREERTFYSYDLPGNISQVVAIDGVCAGPPNWADTTRHFVQALFEVEDLLKKSPNPKPSSLDDLLQRMLRARQGILTEESCKVLLKRGVVKVPGTEDGYQFSHDVKLRIHGGMDFLSVDQFVDFCENVESPLCVINVGECIEQEFSAKND